MGLSRFLVLLKMLPLIRCKELHSRFNSHAKSKAQGTQPTVRTPTCPEPTQTSLEKPGARGLWTFAELPQWKSAADKRVAGSLTTHLQVTNARER